MAKTGTIKNWNDEKGFGFIGPDDGGEDLFVHSSGLVGGAKGLGKGDRVRFTPEFDDRKGKMRASNVSLENGGGGGGNGGGREDRYSRDDRYGGRDDRYGGRDDRNGGRDDRYGGRDDRNGRDDRYGGGGRDDRYGGGRDDRRGGRDRDRDDRGGGGRPERFGGDTRGDDISAGGREHLTARELYMRAQRDKNARGSRRRESRSRSRSAPRRLRRDANFA
mmetsp:Transcript_2635/g.6175  ORF Transcript_2635/g.6175 Transcript_2635/m.6175 type:complete len:220 (+) Transcript_2635:111-770(+)